MNWEICLVDSPSALRFIMDINISKALKSPSVYIYFKKLWGMLLYNKVTDTNLHSEWEMKEAGLQVMLGVLFAIPDVLVGIPHA